MRRPADGWTRHPDPYWLVSGYGLRAWRALACLVAVVILAAVALRAVGFTHHRHPWSSVFLSTAGAVTHLVNLLTAPDGTPVRRSASRSASSARCCSAQRTRALTRGQLDRLLDRRDLPLRERTLWRLLYETAARANELLALDLEDLDLGNRRARVHSKGGAVEWVFWQTGSAQLLPRLLAGRTG